MEVRDKNKQAPPGRCQDAHDRGNEMYHCAMAGDVEKLRALANAGGDVDFVANDGQTLVSGAVLAGHAHVVQLLADLGADIDRAGPNGVPPIIIAASQGHVEVCRVLMARGANTDLEGHSIPPHVRDRVGATLEAAAARPTADEEPKSPPRIALDASAVDAMGVKEMVSFMHLHGVDFSDCMDEESLRERLLESIAPAP